MPGKARFHAFFITLGFVGFSCGPVLITFWLCFCFRLILCAITFAFSPEVVRALGEPPSTPLSQRRDFPFGNRRITLHGLRSGCAISLAMSGVDLQTVMDHVGWKTSNTARHYLRMEQVLKSGGAGDSLAELPLDLVELYRKQNELTGFTRTFEMIVGNSGNV